MSDKVWVVHLDDAAPSSGFEGVFSSLDAAKRFVESQGTETEWREPRSWGVSWDATVKGPDAWMRWYTVTEEEVRD